MSCYEIVSDNVQMVVEEYFLPHILSQQHRQFQCGQHGQAGRQDHRDSLIHAVVWPSLTLTSITQTRHMISAVKFPVLDSHIFRWPIWPQFWQLGSSSSRRVPLSAASSRSWLRLSSFLAFGIDAAFIKLERQKVASREASVSMMLWISFFALLTFSSVSAMIKQWRLSSWLLV